MHIITGLKRRLSVASATFVTMLIQAQVASAQVTPPAGAAGGCSATGFDLTNMLSVLAYIAYVFSGPFMRIVMILAAGVGIAFLLFGGDNVPAFVKTIVGFIVMVVLGFLTISWISGQGSTNCPSTT